MAIRTRVRRTGGYSPGYGGSFVSSSEQAMRDLEARKQYNARFDPTIPDENFAGAVWAGGNRFFDEALNSYVYMTSDGKRTTSPTALAPDAALAKLAATPAAGAPPGGGGGGGGQGGPPAAISTQAPGSQSTATGAYQELQAALHMGGSVIGDDGKVVTVKIGGQTIRFDKTTGKQIASTGGAVGGATTGGGAAAPAGGAAASSGGLTVGQQISGQTSSGATVTGTITAIGPGGEVDVKWADGSTAKYGANGSLVSSTPAGGAAAGGTTTGAGGTTAPQLPATGTAPGAETYDEFIARTGGGGDQPAPVSGGGGPGPFLDPGPISGPTTPTPTIPDPMVPGAGGSFLDPGIVEPPPLAPTAPAPVNNAGGPGPYLDPGVVEPPVYGPAPAPAYTPPPAPAYNPTGPSLDPGITSAPAAPQLYADRYGNQVTLEQLMAQQFSGGLMTSIQQAAATPPAPSYVEPPLWYASQTPGTNYLDPGVVEPTFYSPPSGGAYLTQ